MEEYCVCSHAKSLHTGWLNEPNGCGAMIFHTQNHVDDELCECSEFKLDNLKLIEDEAKRKGLV